LDSRRTVLLVTFYDDEILPFVFVVKNTKKFVSFTDQLRRQMSSAIFLPCGENPLEDNYQYYQIKANTFIANTDIP
jgi:hypothetical protein